MKSVITHRLDTLRKQCERSVKLIIQTVFIMSLILQYSVTNQLTYTCFHGALEFSVKLMGID